jgi:hypothetical protein
MPDACSSTARAGSRIKKSRKRKGCVFVLSEGSITDRFGFEMCTMGSSSSTAGINQLFRNTHVNAYLLS